MPVNSNKPERWKADISQSVDLYNNWFMSFAPNVYRNTRITTTEQVKVALEWTTNLTDVTLSLLRQKPSLLPMLRMTTAPPLARDRLIGLAGVSPHLIKCMEIDHLIPPQMSAERIDEALLKIRQVIMRLTDKDIFPWLEDGYHPSEDEVYRSATIIADRLCGAAADPIIRNAQEQRQLEAIRQWFERKGYLYVRAADKVKFDTMEPGTFAFRLNIQVKMADGTKRVNIPVDAVVMPQRAKRGNFPLLIEAKSAGDFTNTNKRRKEEAAKVSQLRSNFGDKIQYILFLCGYFDSGYLGYEAAEGIDWVWEHRINDLEEFGV